MADCSVPRWAESKDETTADRMAPTKVVRWEIQSAVYSDDHWADRKEPRSAEKTVLLTAEPKDDRSVATMDDSRAESTGRLMVASSEHSTVVRLVAH